MTDEHKTRTTHVDECPNCETRFIGMTADEFREEHAPECNPFLKLLRFTGEQ